MAKIATLKGSFTSTVAASLPSAATAGSGSIYWVSDARILLRSDGTNWRSVAPGSDLVLSTNRTTVTTVTGAQTIIAQAAIPLIASSAQVIVIRGESYGTYIGSSSGILGAIAGSSASSLIANAGAVPGNHSGLPYYIEWSFNIVSGNVAAFIRGTFQATSSTITAAIALGNDTGIAYVAGQQYGFSIQPATSTSITPSINRTWIHSVVL